METEAVAVFARREPVIEYPRQIFRGNTHAVVNHCDPDTVVTVGDADGQALVLPSGLIAGVLRVANQVHQNLQHLVPLH